MSFVNNNKSGFKYQASRRESLIKAAKRRGGSKRGLFGKVKALVSRMEAAIILNFTTGLTTFKRDISSKKLQDAFDAKDYDKAMATIPWEKLEGRISGIEAPIASSIGLVAQKLIPELPKQARKLRFDATNPRVAQYIKQDVGSLVREISDGSRIAIQTTIRRAVDENLSPVEAAKRIKQAVGLTEKQEIAVEAFRKGQVKAGLKGPKLEARVNAYRKRTIDNRAKTIARTEMTRAANQAQIEVWDQAADEGLVDKSKLVKKWITIIDGRTSDICLSLHGQEVPIDAMFTSEYGAWNRPPAHPNCRSEITIEEKLDD